jgi:hypothetical protein
MLSLGPLGLSLFIEDYVYVVEKELPPRPVEDTELKGFLSAFFPPLLVHLKFFDTLLKLITLVIKSVALLL